MAAHVLPSPSNSSIEDIALRYSRRGMNLLREYLKENYCQQAARHLLALERGNVLLTTGFCVAGAAETDGPPGTMCLARALHDLGFTPAIVTDRICQGLFEPEHIPVEYVDLNADEEIFRELLDRYQPVCLISVERCGHNRHNDYINMNGISIARNTAPIDLMFQLASRRHIFTIGIGDGGNEIGMGNLRDVIARKITENPCTVTVDELIIATTSNWGAYALVACLSLQMHKHLLSYREISAYIRKIVALGCVDGITKKTEPSVDGFPPAIEKEIVTALARAAEIS